MSTPTHCGEPMQAQSFLREQDNGTHHLRAKVTTGFKCRRCGEVIAIPPIVQTLGKRGW